MKYKTKSGDGKIGSIPADKLTLIIFFSLQVNGLRAGSAWNIGPQQLLKIKNHYEIYYSMLLAQCFGRTSTCEIFPYFYIQI